MSNTSPSNTPLDHTAQKSRKTRSRNPNTTQTTQKPTGQGWSAAARSAPWALAGAVFLAVFGTSVGMIGVVSGSNWLLFVAFTVAVVLSAMALARTFKVHAALIPVIGGLALILQLTTVFLSNTAFLGFIPTPASLDQVGTLLSQASQTVVQQAAPVQVNNGVLLVICFGTGLVAMLVDALAIGVMMPAISGLGLLGIALVPGIIKPESLGILGFILGAVGYLLLMVLTQFYFNENRAKRPLREQWRIGGIGAGAVVLALLLASITPGFTAGTFPQGSRLTPFGQVAGLSPFITLGNDLRNPTNSGQITYATTAASPPYLRTLTIENFEGESWQPTDRSSESIVGLEQIQNDFAASSTELQTVTTQITPISFSDEWLPVPYAPERVTGISGRWVWDPKTLAIKALDEGTLGQSYQVQSLSPVLTPEILETAITPPRPSLDPIFMAIPANTPSVIRETALQITGTAPTYYDKAMAIQDYLRGPDFSYSLQAPVSGGYDGSSMDALAMFLDVKSGYCVHFSAAMAVMAREAGIPSRIAVGFAPGTATGQTVDLNGQQLTEYQVDGRSAHSWPELYFEGLGWVPFEPTPSRGQVPDYAQPPAASQSAEAPDPLPSTQQPTATPRPSSTPAPQVQGEPTGTGDGGVNLVWAAIPLLLAAVLAVPGFSRGALRRRRLSAAPTARSAWAELRDSALDFGLDTETSDTPRRFARRLADSGLVGTPGPDIDSLVLSYERSSYGPPTPQQSIPEDAAELVQAREALAALERNAPLRTRIRAAVFPKTIMSRIARTLTRPFNARPFQRVGTWLRQLVRRR